MTEPHPETIVAISTPPGRGGLGVVRLSGVNAHKIAEPLFASRRPPAHGRVHFTRLVDPETREPLDEVVVTFFAAPHSYTSEDTVEISAHGSPVLLEYIVRECLKRGARLAEAGEFTKRAFLSGRLDLTEAEAVNDLIQATTLQQARVAASQLGGNIARLLGPTKQRLIRLIAELEAGIDFAEDDIEGPSTNDIVEQLRSIEAPLTKLQSSFAYGRILREGFSLAIVGRPNAGKSSLFNALLERNRAIVTATPGTTRDLVTERLSLEGIPVELIDTAGLREANDEIERLGIERSREALADADVLLLVLDITMPLHAEDIAILDKAQDRAVVIAWNKSDLRSEHNASDETNKVTYSVAANASAILPPKSHTTAAEVSVSALSGAGLVELRAALLAAVQVTASSGETGVLTNIRQHGAVSASLKSVTAAATAVQRGLPHEMILIDLHESLRALDELTGATVKDDILNLIFSTFCIGK